MQSLDTIWGRRLTAARTAQDLSIAELARRAGIHKSHLARFERGEAGLGDEGRIRVAAELGHQVADLFPYPDTTTQESKCPSAASAPEGGASPTPATKAAPRSDARSAAAPDASAPEANHASDVEREVS